ncbi:MAG: hypothetical protein QF590_01890 [Dehalococcoidia bacterium]|jgi:hypothetical protein|nr:hypothetical protein [Chloroflexota bacterium]MDP6055623.1 hypothetical protein [Dehalococcoidia bacterium]MDP7090030.1 hypothetical protein [Dehalococcoidia bacterium]
MTNTNSDNQTLKPVMGLRPPNEIMFEESFWDELADAGVNEVALQWICLLEDRGGDTGNVYPQEEDGHPRGLAAMGGKRVNRLPRAAFDPTPEFYEGLTWQPPMMPAHLAEQGKKLSAALDMGIAKGFKIYAVDDKGYFLSGGFGTGLLDTSKRPPNFTNPEMPAMTIARARDTAKHFPQVTGIMLDGPDFKWEIKPGHRDDMWVERIDTTEFRSFASENGMDFQKILDGREHFKEFLHGFTPDYARKFISESPGALASHDWWRDHPKFTDWFSFKQAAVEWSVSSSYNGVKKHLPDMQVGNSSRLPFAEPLTGHNTIRKQQYTDFQQPKQYWWSGGVAGFRGTIFNWVETLVDWNDGLDTDLASELFSSMFDYPLAASYPISDYNGEATDEWFTTGVRDQTTKMLANSGGSERYMPWVGLEHFGSNWLTASELDRLLAEMQSQGATRYCYFIYNSMEPEIWNVIQKYARGRSYGSTLTRREGDTTN